MEEDSLYQILTACYEDTLKSSIAWNVYQKVLDLCQDGDLYTITYLHKLCLMGKEEKLAWRMKIAERGFELTPNEVDQYMLIIGLALKSETTL